MYLKKKNVYMAELEKYKIKAKVLGSVEVLRKALNKISNGKGR